MQTEPLEPSEEHLGEDTLELYSMGKLPEAEAASVEEHLLICPQCQERLEETDDFVRAVRAASARLNDRTSARGFFSQGWNVLTQFRMAWAAAAILGMLVGTWLYTLRGTAGKDLSPPLAVVLDASRSPAGTGGNQAPAGNRLVLTMDLTEVASFPSYEVEVVEAEGGLVQQSAAQPDGGRLSVEITQPLVPGQYWVRLYRPSPHKELLREYPLRIRR